MYHAVYSKTQVSELMIEQSRALGHFRDERQQAIHYTGINTEY